MNSSFPFTCKNCGRLINSFWDLEVEARVEGCVFLQISRNGTYLYEDDPQEMNLDHLEKKVCCSKCGTEIDCMEVYDNKVEFINKGEDNNE